MNSDWDDAGWDWLKRQLTYRLTDSSDKIYPALWNDPRFGFTRQTVPVVGVSWFEANAYCQWLKRHWDNLEEGRTNPSIRPNQIRLQTELEWVYAAGGDYKSERFPWDKNNSTTKEIGEITRRMNVRESGIGRTTSVALYPLGSSYPFGLWDMAGNVWEWMANYYSSAHLYLALRSGSWVNTTEFARLTGRLYNFGPSNRWNDRGFRVVVII
jgi:formylglycine-generating enzyme required for sulfatase activity